MAEFLEYKGNKGKGILLVKKAKPQSPHRKVEYKKNQVWKLGKDLPKNIGHFIHFQNPALFKIRKEEDNPIELFEELIQKASEIQNENEFDPIDILKKYFEVSKSKAPIKRGRPKK